MECTNNCTANGEAEQTRSPQIIKVTWCPMQPFLEIELGINTHISSLNFHTNYCGHISTTVTRSAYTQSDINYSTVWMEILAGIKFGGWPLNCHCKNIGGFKFGGSVRDRHMYICKYEILADFNLAVAKVDRQTAKFSSYTVCSITCACSLQQAIRYKLPIN